MCHSFTGNSDGAVKSQAILEHLQFRTTQIKTKLNSKPKIVLTYKTFAYIHASTH